MGTAFGYRASQTRPLGLEWLCGRKQQWISVSETLALAFPNRVILVSPCSVAPSIKGQTWCTYSAQLLKRLRACLSKVYLLFSAQHTGAAYLVISLCFVHMRPFPSIRLPGTFLINTGKCYFAWRWAVKGWDKWLSWCSHRHSLSIAAVWATRSLPSLNRSWGLSGLPCHTWMWA